MAGNQAAVSLLDLPSEIRVTIFRHLLVHPQGLDVDLARQWPVPSVAILALLRTCRVIYREAFEIFYGENQFRNALSIPYSAMTRYQWIIDTIRHMQFEIDLFARYSEIRRFLAFMRYFAHPSQIRGTLNIELRLHRAEVYTLKWFIRALGRFTNFKTIELHFTWFFWILPREAFRVGQYVKTALEPLLGQAEDFGSGWVSLELNMRFHPTEHQQHIQREPDDSDWADSLDGLRLEWDENTTDTENSETPGQN